MLHSLCFAEADAIANMVGIKAFCVLGCSLTRIDVTMKAQAVPVDDILTLRSSATGARRLCVQLDRDGGWSPKDEVG